MDRYVVLYYAATNQYHHLWNFSFLTFSFFVSVQYDEHDVKKTNGEKKGGLIRSVEWVKVKPKSDAQEYILLFFYSFSLPKYIKVSSKKSLTFF